MLNHPRSSSWKRIVVRFLVFLARYDNAENHMLQREETPPENRKI
jgi:hypothetical protein